MLLLGSLLTTAGELRPVDGERVLADAAGQWGSYADLAAALVQRLQVAADLDGGALDQGVLVLLHGLDVARCRTLPWCWS